MKIYYSYIDKYYNGASSLSKREKERLLGRKIVLEVAKSVYDIDDEIVYDGKRPHFKDDGIYFSISHSENLVVVAFDKLPVGIDIEFIKERELDKLIKRYRLEKTVNNLTDFYRWWTAYEAKYKNSMMQKIHTFEILPKYICSVATELSKNINDIEIIKF